MKKVWATKWVKALRSGEYKQTKGVLYNGKGYCCLGVLCKITGEEFTYSKEKNRYCVRGGGSNLESVLLPLHVINKVGMKSCSGLWLRHEDSLSELNDQGKSFERIAAIIEENYKEL